MNDYKQPEALQKSFGLFYQGTFLVYLFQIFSER